MAIVIPILSQFDNKGLKQAQRSLDTLGKAGSQAGQALKTALMPAVAAMGALAVAGAGAIKAAVEDQKTQVLLAKQLRTTTNATEQQIASLESYVTSMQLATGVADTDLRNSLATLVRATGDVTRAQEVLNTALDISAGTGKDLEKISMALAKAENGNYAALKKLGIPLGENTNALIEMGKASKKVQKAQLEYNNTFRGGFTAKEQAKALNKLKDAQKELNAVTVAGADYLKDLTKLFGGQASAKAETLQGRMERVKQAMGEVYEQIGYSLLPMFEKMLKFVTDKILPRLRDLADAFSKEGLSGAIKEAIGWFDEFVSNAKGWNAVLINLVGTVLALVAAFKAFSFLVTVAGWISTVKAGLTGLVGVIPRLAAVTTGTLVGAFALVAATVYELIDALRDPIFRTEFVKYIQNTMKLVGNAFILTYNVIATGLNSIYKVFQTFLNGAINVINFFNPFKDIPSLPDSKLPTYDFMKFDFSSGQGGTAPSKYGTARQYEQSPMNIYVTSADPNAVVQALKKWNRQNGAIPIRVAN